MRGSPAGRRPSTNVVVEDFDDQLKRLVALRGSYADEIQRVARSPWRRFADALCQRGTDDALGVICPDSACPRPSDVFKGAHRSAAYRNGPVRALTVNAR